MIDIGSDKVVQVIYLSREGTAARSELEGFIDNLNVDEKAELVAIAWIGRGSFDVAEFAHARTIAVQEATTPTSSYLCGMPHLAENLEAGLDALGVDVTGAEEDFL